MTALKLHHDAVTKPEPQHYLPVPGSQHQSPQPPPHSRSTSNISELTYQAASGDSHPTEPLLDSQTPESIAYLDLLSRQPSHPNGFRSDFEDVLELNGDPITPHERKHYKERAVRSRIRRLRIAKVSFQSLILIWSVYNTIRYFIAFSRYTSATIQAGCIVLASFCTISFVFLTISIVLALAQSSLVTRGFPLLTVLLIRNLFQYISSALLVAPAVINVVLIFLWRHSSDPQLQPSARCHVDLDVLWPVPSTQCDSRPPQWSVWLTLALVRLSITSIVVVLYHLSSFYYQRTRRPWSTHFSFSSSSSSSSRRNHNPSHSEDYLSSLGYRTTAFHLEEGDDEGPMRELKHNKRPSSSTLATATTATANSLTRTPSTIGSYKGGKIAEALRNSTSHSKSSSLSVGASAAGFFSPALSVDGGAESPTTTTTMATVTQISRSQLSTPGNSPQTPRDIAASDAVTNDQDIHGFVDRFRSLISQISKETDDGLDFANRGRGRGRGHDGYDYGYGEVGGGDEDGDEDGSERTESPVSSSEFTEGHEHGSYSYSYDYHHSYGGSGSGPDRRYHSVSLGYDEFGRPYRPDESVVMLNGVVKRMPTIESIGSRELGSSMFSGEGEDGKDGNGNGNGKERERMSVIVPSRNNSAGGGGGGGNGRPRSPSSHPNDPPSRRSSLRTSAEILRGMGRANEVGEFALPRSDGGVEAGTGYVAKRFSAGSGTSSVVGGGIGLSSDSVSLTSFHTAAAAATAEGELILDVHGDGSPPSKLETTLHHRTRSV